MDRLPVAPAGNPVPGRFAPALVFGILLANYLLSAPRAVMLDDDGYFILAAWSGGVAHPPGYPLYTMIAGLFAHLLPVGSVAFRVHVCSAVFGALACAILWQVALRVTASRGAAWVAALCFGFSGPFWSQATVAEVYTLNAFLFFLLLYLCMTAADGTPDERRGPFLAGLFGLSLTNHWPLMLLSAPALAVAAWPARRMITAATWKCIAAFCLGLTPYLWLVWRSRVSEIAFFGPVTGWDDLWFYLSRAPYADVDHGEYAGWADKFRYAGFALADAVRAFGVPAAALAAAGFVLQWRLPRTQAWSLALAFAGSTVVLAFLLGFDWDRLHRSTFSVYPHLAHGVLAIWVGLAVAALSGVATRRGVHLGRGVQVLLGGALVLLVWLHNAPDNLRVRDRWAADFAATVLGTLPPGAVLFTYGDYSTGPVAYAHFIEGVRPDVRLYSPRGLLFSNRLFSARAAGSGAARAATREFVAREPAPVFYTTVLEHGHGVVLHGLYFEADRGQPPRHNSVRLAPEINAYFTRLLDGPRPRDVSQRIHRTQLGILYCRALAAVALDGDDAAIRQRLHRLCDDYYGLLEQAGLLLAQDPPRPRQALLLLERAAARRDEAVTVRGLANLDRMTVRARTLLQREHSTLIEEQEQ